MAIIGNSGSGKSTLLNMIGGLDKPSAGKLAVDGKDLFKFDEMQMIDYKRETVGFVWQNNARNLIPYLTALENVELVMSFNVKNKDKDRSKQLLELVGMSHRLNSKLGQLSGGEQQRVAIAIGLANNPKILLADEPTGSVDTRTAAQILDLFRDLNKNLGLTVVIVTHDRQLSRKVDRVVAIRDGRTSSEFIRKRSYAEELAELEKGMEHGKDDETHVELAVVDRAGRLQIPREYLEALGLKGSSKVRVELEEGRILLLPPEIDNEKPV
jgi:ABC-type lipoprotein export system ATPase subunit